MLLRDLGERKIIEQILRPRYAPKTGSFGNDCASFPVGKDEYVIATTDPCPRPMASILGFTDFYYWGWLLSAINLSDLAAAGAEPVGLLTSLVLPSDLSVENFERILAGIDDCCEVVGTNVIGGNLKEGSEIALTGTAIGRCDTPPLSRSGAKPGDAILVIGDLGNFWAGYFVLTRNLTLAPAHRETLLRNILTPIPKVGVGTRLRRTGLIRACMDNSDGLYPSLVSLGHANRLGTRLDFSKIRFAAPVNAVARELGIEPIRLALGWGDWQLIVGTAVDDVPYVEAICAQNLLETFVIGSFCEGDGVSIDHRGRSGSVMSLDSQRFAADSWFETGVDSYANFMLGADLLH